MRSFVACLEAEGKPGFAVTHHKDMILVWGFPPLADLSVLLGKWDRDGWRYLTKNYHRTVGATCGCVRTPPDEPQGEME